MADSVPPGKRIDRAGLERIIQRAAELQAREAEIGEGLTDDEVLQLGKEVGISGTHLRRALVEEQTRSIVTTERGVLTWLAGPARVAAERTIDREEEHLQLAINYWMTEGELLTVKRRYPDGVAWEARGGTMAALKRSFGAGGRSYQLARAREIVSQVFDLGGGRSHIRLLADLGNTRRDHLGGALGMTITGSGLSAVALTLGVMVPVALVPIPLGIAIGYSVVRARRSEVEKVQVALEQVLDKLEHGEIDVPPTEGAQPTHPIARIAEEIRKQLSN